MLSKVGGAQLQCMCKHCKILSNFEMFATLIPIQAFLSMRSHGKVVYLKSLSVK